MSEADLTVAILREIRDEIRLTRTELKGEIGGTNARLDFTRTELKGEIGGTNARLDTTNARLEVVEETLKDLAGQQLMLTRYVKNVVDRHELSIDDLRERMVRVETKLGS